MARYSGAVCRLCRREGLKLFLKGSRCYSKKCSFERRPTPPGQHGVRRRKVGDYGLQLRAKQKLKGYYGDITEKQFKRAYQEANRMKGDTSQNLIGLLERRLDMIVYRAKFAPTIFAARQIVSHGNIRVNGVAPGAILWPEGGVSDQMQDVVLKQIPLKRVGEPSDIAACVLYLVRDAHYVTGQIIAVDGGRSVGW